MKVASFYNNKGGVCKSSICLNLGMYFASLGLKTLIVDLDPSSNSTHYFFKKRSGSQRDFKKTIKNLLDPDDKTDKLSSVIYKSERIENLYVAPSEFDLDKIEMKMIRQSPTEDFEYKYTLKNAIDSFDKEFDICLLDLHPSRRSLLNYNALIASDYVFIPCDKDVETIEGLGSCISVIKEMTEFNKKLKIGGIIYVKFNGGRVDFKRAFPELVSALGDNKECKLLESVIPFVSEQDELRWNRRAVFNRPSKKSEKLVEAYKDLGQEVLQIMGIEGINKDEN